MRNTIYRYEDKKFKEIMPTKRLKLGWKEEMSNSTHSINSLHNPSLRFEARPRNIVAMR